MFGFQWKCPDCGHENTEDATYAVDNACKCESCGIECEVYFSVKITATSVTKI